MNNSINLEETRIKTLFKKALVEVIEENQELVSSILTDALEDIGISLTIEEGETSKTVSRDEILRSHIILIMKSTLSNQYCIFFYCINKTMFFSNSSRPKTRPIIF